MCDSDNNNNNNECALHRRRWWQHSIPAKSFASLHECINYRRLRQPQQHVQRNFMHINDKKSCGERAYIRNVNKPQIASRSTLAGALMPVRISAATSDMNFSLLFSGCKIWTATTTTDTQSPHRTNMAEPVQLLRPKSNNSIINYT